MASKSPVMSWTSEHDLIFCKEVIFINPYSAKKKSVQRSARWQQIAENLNSIQSPRFIVDKRSVRDHIGVLIQRFKRKEAAELRESGTTPERTELDDAIEQIIAMEESADTEQQEINDERKEKLEGDRKKAEDIRKKAMETVGQTLKRKSEEGSKQAKKSRRSGSETVEFLKLKAEEDRVMKAEELEIKRKEHENNVQAQAQQAQVFKNMVEQQQQQQKHMQDMQNLLLLQQQQQTQALMAIIDKLAPK